MDSTHNTQFSLSLHFTQLHKILLISHEKSIHISNCSIVQELAETESYKCSGVVSRRLACPLACQGKPSCLPMCCPPGQGFDGSSCQSSANKSDWIQDLAEADFSFEWSGYSNGLYSCEPEQFTQVRGVRFKVKGVIFEV